MSEPTSAGSPPPFTGPSGDRLDSWKEIAAYLKRDVTTVQRWEKREGMPVRRHLHDKMGSVYALRTELDSWTRSRSHAVDDLSGHAPLGAAEPDVRGTIVDFDGTEQAAAISRDGRFVAFLSDRDGRADVWLTQVGTGHFHKLTRDAKWELVNPSVRTLGFSPDGALVTFWARKPDGSKEADISVWAVPILGGQPRPYLEGVAEFDWSSDGAHLVYHTSGPGDPMFVRNSGQTPASRQIFAAPTGLHSHFLLWSMDHAFIYFVQGSPPDRMDVWRIKPAGGTPERVTNHDSRVSHPVFANPRTLLYLANDSSGAGPCLYSVDVERRIPHRLSSGMDRYTSLAASADGGRLVATLATTKRTLWRLPNTGTMFEASAGSRIPLTSGGGFSPRLGPGFMLYVSSTGANDSIWRLQDDRGTELWKTAGARILAGPSIDPDGRRIAFTTRQGGQALLYVMNSDGTEARVVSRSLEWQGAAAWAPDGRSITTAALAGGVPHLFNVPLDGRPPEPLLREQSLDPVWSPDGSFLVFSGPDIGTTFPVRAITADARAYPLPNLTLSRGARHLRFLPGRRALVVLRGEIRHKNLWLIDLEKGDERQLTNLPPDFDVGDFDISPDGREAVLERVEERSNIVLLDLPR